MAKYITIFLLAVCVLPLKNGLAQNTKKFSGNGVVMLVPDNKSGIAPEPLLNLKLQKFTGLLAHRIYAKPLPNSSYEKAMEAAKMDPGILIYHNPNDKAKIVCIRPEGNVDPEMIITVSKADTASTDSP